MTEQVEGAAQAAPEAPAEPVSKRLTLEALRSRERTKTVFLDGLSAEIVVRKLPATMIQDPNFIGQSTIELALKYGVADPKIDDALLEELTFEEAEAISQAVEDFNPGVLSVATEPQGDEAQEVAAERRKQFPAEG